MQRQSTHILVEVILSLYLEATLQRGPEVNQQLMGLIMHYLKNLSCYTECVQTSIAIAGTSQPIDRLHDILSVGSEPIPFDENEAADDPNTRKKSRTWTTYEDNRLIAGIYKYGIDNWTSISRFIGNGRTRSQCSQRWQRGLDPHLSKDQWTVAEEAYLLQLVAYYGEKSWTQIASKMGNRSDVQCRYRYKQMQKDRSLHSRSIAAANTFQYGGGGVRKTQSTSVPSSMIMSQQNTFGKTPPPNIPIPHPNAKNINNNNLNNLNNNNNNMNNNNMNNMNNNSMNNMNNMNNNSMNNMNNNMLQMAPNQMMNQQMNGMFEQGKRIMQQPMFSEDFHLMMPRYYQGNLRPSQSVPTIQFQPIPNGMNGCGSSSKIMTPNEIEQRQLPPAPPQRVAPPRPSNSDLIFDMFNDSFFEDHDFDDPAPSPAPAPDTTLNQTSPIPIPSPSQTQQIQQQQQQQQQQVNHSEYQENIQNQERRDLVSSFFLPTFDSDLFSIF